MTSFSHLVTCHITILGYTMIGLQEGHHKKRFAQTTKGYSMFKNICSVKINRKPVNVVDKYNRSKLIHALFCKYFNILNI